MIDLWLRSLSASGLLQPCVCDLWLLVLPPTQVSSVVDDTTSRISALLGSMDSVLLTLDHASVSGVYNQGKSFFCCTLTQQIYTQWAATITVIALALVALQCAMFVLSNLDSLSGVYVRALCLKAWGLVPHTVRMHAVVET